MARTGNILTKIGEARKIAFRDPGRKICKMSAQRISAFRIFIWDGFSYEVCSRVWVWLMTVMIVMIWNCPSVLHILFKKSPGLLIVFEYSCCRLRKFEFSMWQAFIISFPCSNVALAGREWASKSEAPPATRSTASRGEAPNMLGEVHGVWACTEIQSFDHEGTNGSQPSPPTRWPTWVSTTPSTLHSKTPSLTTLQVTKVSLFPKGTEAKAAPLPCKNRVRELRNWNEGSSVVYFRNGRFQFRAL